MAKIVVGYSGGVTSAWAAAWALRQFNASDVVWLFHDTKEEHPDTYRFIKQFSEVVGHPITIEWQRVQRATIRGEQGGYKTLFPLVAEAITKQQAADFCMSLGVRPPAMYRWSEHANCIGCLRGGKAYWLKVAENEPVIFQQRCELEAEFGHTILKDTTLVQLKATGLKRAVRQRESIEISCECGS